MHSLPRGLAVALTISGIVLSGCAFDASARPPTATTAAAGRGPAIGTRGMVATAHPLAAEAGIAIRALH